MPPETTAPVRKPALTRCPHCDTLNRVDLARLANRPKCAQCHRPLLLDRPQTVTDRDFQRIVQSSSVPVLVDFYADWCGPCHIMAPTLDDFAAARQGDVLVLKVDTDANQQTSMQYGIRSIPTMIAFRGGKEIRRQVGVSDRATLEGMIGEK